MGELERSQRLAASPAGRGDGAVAPARPSGARLAAFRYAAFRLFWIGQLATNIGTWMQIVATGWLVLELTDSPAFLGLNAVFQGLPILACALVGGVVADRFDRYRLMVGAQLVQLFPDVALALLVATGQVHVVHIFVYSLLTAVINGLTTPARQAFVPRLVPPPALVSAVALNSAVWQGGAVVGPTVAGLVLAAWGTPGNFYLNVVSDLVNLGAMLLIRAAPASSPPVRESPWQSLAQGTRYVFREANVRTLLLAVAALSLLGRPYTQLLPVFARDVFHTGPQGLGVMLTMPAIGAVAAAFGLGLLGESASTSWFLAMSVAQALALGAFAASPVFGVSLALLFVMGATSAVASALANTLLLQLVEERMRGRVMGFFMAATWGGWRLGAFPAGLVAEGWGAQPALGLCAATLLAVQAPLARSKLLRAGAGLTRTRH
jgi:MFS family permease